MARRCRSGSPIDGLLLLDKPTGITSNRALQTAKHLLGARKAGHTGSLDPLASGLLPLCFGKTTRIASMLLDADKAYRTTIRLDIATESGDMEGQVTGEYSFEPSENDIREALQGFRGEIEQKPPMFSAIKRNGQPAYKLARKGIKIALASRKVTVYSLELLATGDHRITLDIHCSKGFYIRSLAMALGQVLGCGGTVEALRRTRAGALTIEQCVTLEQLAALPDVPARQELLIPTDHALAHLPRISITGIQARRFCQGQAVNAHWPGTTGLVRTYSVDNGFLGLGEAGGDGRLAPRRLFVQE